MLPCRPITAKLALKFGYRAATAALRAWVSDAFAGAIVVLLTGAMFWIR